MPSYFRFLTLLAFHTLLCENVDATILEVGMVVHTIAQMLFLDLSSQVSLL